MAPYGSGAAGAMAADTPAIVLHGRYEITNVAMSGALGSPSAAAYAALDRLNAQRPVIALVCDPDLPPRAEVAEYLKGAASKAMMLLLDMGVIAWPDTGDYRQVMIFERPNGTRLVPAMDQPFEPVPHTDIVDQIMAPICETLVQLATIGIVHGAIRPTNIFRPDGEKPMAILGEGLTAPPHSHQPPAFCSISLMQADPAGRGNGQGGDDIYALGVSVLTLVIGRDPAEGRDAATLLHDKIERGSFFTLCGHHRLPAHLREPLRGMLEDRPEKRWSVADLRAWLTERRLKPSHHSQMERAERGLSLGGKAFYRPQPLAQWLVENWDTVRFDEQGHEILNWARRGLCDDAVAESVLRAMETSERNADPGSTAHAAFIARLAMALDPAAPIRYRHIAVHYDAIGDLLSNSVNAPATMQAVTELLIHDLHGFRLRMMGEADGVRPSVRRALDREVRALKNPGIGYGLEHCIYGLGPSQYCLSPLVRKAKVMSIEALLPALERESARHHGGPPFDRDIAAFAATRLKVELGSHLAAAGDPRDPERAALGMLGVLATIQAQTGGKGYPGIARWIGKYLAPAIDGFHHATYREKVRAELPNLIERGDIAAIYMYLANGELRIKDRNAYAEAVAEYARIATEISVLKSMGYSDPRRVREYGHQIAAGLAGILSLVAFAFSCALLW